MEREGDAGMYQQRLIATVTPLPRYWVSERQRVAVCMGTRGERWDTDKGVEEVLRQEDEHNGERKCFFFQNQSFVSNIQQEAGIKDAFF